MSDVEVIVYTACATLIGGVILLILTELINSFIMLPLRTVREHLPVVLSRLDFHSNRLTNFFPEEPSEDEQIIIRIIKKDLREAATDLNSKYKMVPFKNFLSYLRFVPSQNEVDVAYKGLIYLHNSILYEDRLEFVINQIEMNHNHIDRIHAALTSKKIPVMIEPKERE